MGFRGQDINLYRYVKNQPTGFVDPSGSVSIDPNFNHNCLPSLNRALNIVHQLPKKCDCEFSKIGTHGSFTDLINDPGITIHSAPNDDVTSTGPNGHEGAYTNPGDTHDIYLRPETCRFGAWMIPQNQLDRSPRSNPIVSFWSEKFLLCFVATVLIFFIAGLLYLLCLEHVDNLGAHSIPSETGLLIPSGYDNSHSPEVTFVRVKGATEESRVVLNERNHT